MVGDSVFQVRTNTRSFILLLRFLSYIINIQIDLGKLYVELNISKVQNQNTALFCFGWFWLVWFGFQDRISLCSSGCPEPALWTTPASHPQKSTSFCLLSAHLKACVTTVWLEYCLIALAMVEDKHTSYVSDTHDTALSYRLLSASLLSHMAVNAQLT